MASTAEGLTESEFESMRPSKPAARPLSQAGLESLRAEIYARHGIPEGTSAADAARVIELLAHQQGYGPSAWANPEERAAAREAYAREGKTPAEVNKRWEESQYLLDPRTYQYMQKYGRDADLVGSIAADDAAAKANPSGRRPANVHAIPHYESSAGQRLYRQGIGNPLPNAPATGYQRFSGYQQSLANALSNPDVPLGAYMTASETVPNYLRMQGSGETSTAGESWRAAEANRLANNAYRLASPAPILRLPAGATQEDIGRSIAELQKEVGSASVPFADERWRRTAGFTPAGYLSDALDFGISMVDPTVVVPAAKGAGALTNAARAATRAAKIAGGGWVGPAVKNAVRPVAADLATDAGSEQVLGAGIQGSLGGIPNRTWGQWAKGGGEPGKDFSYKSDEQVQQAKEAREALHQRLKDDGSIENADKEAYSRLRADGTLPNPPKFYWGMSPSAPAY